MIRRNIVDRWCCLPPPSSSTAGGGDIIRQCAFVARNVRCINFSSSSAPSIDGATESAPPAAGSKLDKWLEAWNEHSGTHEITKLKELVHNSSLKFDKQQRLVADARKAVDHALSAWEDSQIKHSQLMQIRDKWTPAQALEFAKLLEKEVQVRSNLEQAKKDLAEKETHQSKLQIDYMNNLRKRYHEEQIWTDRWRILSTYGTWGLIALNSVVFLISQYLFRLREQQRMKDFETLLKETLSSNTSTLLAIREHQNDIIEQRNESQNNTALQQGKEGQSKEQPITAKKEEEGSPELLSYSSREETGKQLGRTKHEERGQIIMAVSEKDGSDEQKPADSSTWHENKRVPSSSQRKLLSTLKTKLDRDEKMATFLNQTLHLLVTSWTNIRQHATAAKIDCADKVDLPSAALGACVTSVVWLVAMSLSRKGGQ
jgi:hypothetical protein